MYYTHGLSETPEYRSWESMKQRCLNPNRKSYSDYGGRGIAVCDRWKNSFENFFADMRLKPTAKHSLDRIYNDGDYSPKNCKWSTRVEQQNNRRNNKPLITIGNETYTIAQWTKKMGYGKTVIQTRLDRGWSDYDAVMTPVHTDKLITDGVKILTIAQWGIEMGYGKTVIQTRLDRGWSESDAILTTVKNRKTKKLNEGI